MGKQAFLNRIKWESGQPGAETVTKDRGPMFYRTESKELILLREGEAIPSAGVCCYAYLFDQELVKPKAPKPEKVTDERAKHPAIQAVRDLLRRFPDKVLWDEVIKAAGDAPNVELMNSCYAEWTRRGYKPFNLAWLFQWYAKGGPNGVNGAGRSTNTPENTQQGDGGRFHISKPGPR